MLVYTVDGRDPVKQRVASHVIALAATRDCILTYQALAEFFHATVRKVMISADDAAAMVRDWMVVFPTTQTTARALDRAMTEVQRGRFSVWDAQLLATAEEIGCTVALSEDMGDGNALGNIVVRTPFAGDDLSPAAREVLGL